MFISFFFFFSSRRRHTRFSRDWSSDVCSSDLLFFNLNKEKARLGAMGIEPTAAEIARRLGVEEQEVSDMDRRLSSGEMSLDAPVGDTAGRPVSRLDMMPTSASGPDTAVADGEIQQMVKE